MTKQADELNTLIAGLNALQKFWINAYLIEGSGPENFMLQMQIETGEEIRAAAERGDIGELRAHWREMMSDLSN